MSESVNLGTSITPDELLDNSGTNAFSGVGSSVEGNPLSLPIIGANNATPTFNAQSLSTSAGQSALSNILNGTNQTNSVSSILSNANSNAPFSSLTSTSLGSNGLGGIGTLLAGASSQSVAGESTLMSGWPQILANIVLVIVGFIILAHSLDRLPSSKTVINLVTPSGRSKESSTSSGAEALETVAE
jgi:hypothetical protein